MKEHDKTAILVKLNDGEHPTMKELAITLQEASSFIISMGADFPRKEEVSRLIQTHQILE